MSSEELRDASQASQSVELVQDQTCIGEVVEVSNSALALALISNGSAGAGIGDFVIIEADSGAVVGRITGIRMGAKSPVASVDVRATIHLPHGKVSAGVALHPAIGSRAFRPSHLVIQSVVEDRGSVFETAESGLRVQFCRTADSLKVPLSFAPERMFGRHCAVLGTSGAGKSWTLARLVEECAATRSKVLLIDPTGEFEPLTNGVFHVHIGTARRTGLASNEASLPYRELTEADLVAVFRPSSGTQYIKLRSAIKTLKLLQCEPKLATEGLCIKAHKSKIQFEAAYKLFRKEVENPYNIFDINKLPVQLELECVDPTRSSTEPSIWGGVNGFDQSACVPLINRIQDLLNSDELETIFKPSRQPSIFQALHSFLRDPNVSVLRISFEFLPTSHRVREVVANSIGRHLLALARTFQHIGILSLEFHVDKLSRPLL